MERGTVWGKWIPFKSKHRQTHTYTQVAWLWQRICLSSFKLKYVVSIVCKIITRSIYVAYSRADMNNNIIMSKARSLIPIPRLLTIYVIAMGSGSPSVASSPFSKRSGRLGTML